jgi:hypothetical protein
MDRLLRHAYADGSPSYYRTAVTENRSTGTSCSASCSSFGREPGAIVPVGPMLDRVVEFV